MMMNSVSSCSGPSDTGFCRERSSPSFKYFAYVAAMMWHLTAWCALSQRARRGPGDEPHPLVVKRGALADVGGSRAHENVGASTVAQMPSLGDDGHVATLFMVMGDAHVERADGRLQPAEPTVLDAGRRFGMHGDDERSVRFARPLRRL